MGYRRCQSLTFDPSKPRQEHVNKLMFPDGMIHGMWVLQPAGPPRAQMFLRPRENDKLYGHFLTSCQMQVLDNENPLHWSCKKWQAYALEQAMMRSFAAQLEALP